MWNKILGFISFLMIISGTVLLTYFSDGIDINDDFVPGEVVVKYKYSSFLTKNHRITNNSLDNDRIILEKNSEDFLKENQLIIKNVLNEKTEGNIALITISDNTSVKDIINKLSRDPNVELIEPNYLYYSTVTTNRSSNKLISSIANDPRGKDQRALEYISRPEAYLKYKNLLKQGEPVVVGVIDDGVNYNHVDLQNSMRNPSSCTSGGVSIECIHGYDFYSNTSEPLPMGEDHGTNIAGIIAAEVDNGKGIMGINPYAKIAALRTSCDGSLYYVFNGYSIMQAIEFATENGIRIINASYGSVRDYLAPDIISSKIEEFGEAGGLFVAGAGNDDINMEGQRKYHYPCAYNLDNIICVAAHDSAGKKSSYSNVGEYSVDIAAPGDSILTTTTKLQETYDYLETFEFCYQKNNQINNQINNNNNSNGWYYGYCDKNSYSYRFRQGITSPEFDITDSHDGHIIRFSASCDIDYHLDLIAKIYDKSGKFSEFKFDVSNKQKQYKLHVPEGYSNISVSLEKEGNAACSISSFRIYGVSRTGIESDDYGYSRGTSMATPHVAALASLIWTLKPELTPLQVKDLILDNGDDSKDFKGYTVSGKTINVKRTLDALGLDVPEPELPIINRQEFDNNQTILHNTGTSTLRNNNNFSNNNKDVENKNQKEVINGYRLRTGTINNFINNDLNNNLFDEMQTHYSAFDTSRYQRGPSTEIINELGYTREQLNAYNFAKKLGITTAKDIESADLGGSLTRIAFSKMISQFAINLLGFRPDYSKQHSFNDVSNELNYNYNHGPLLAYQLGIMGINVKNFRPYDKVTRAEFATVLSRLIYKTIDGNGNTKYYEPHLYKLKYEGILSNTDPYRIEKRGLAMLMLMRVAINNKFINI